MIKHPYGNASVICSVISMILTTSNIVTMPIAGNITTTRIISGIFLGLSGICIIIGWYKK
jgi:hypothetical protein